MFTTGKILLPIDFSAGSTEIAGVAAPIAERFGSEITLLHVLSKHFDLHFTATPESTLRDLRASARAEAERKLEEFLVPKYRHLAVKRVLLEGDAAAKIVGYAHSEHSTLIMMATHGYGPFRRLLLGSTTAKVLHDARCPVWTAVHRPPTASAPHSSLPHHIACALDLGPQSHNILSWASRLSWEFGASLSVIHVVASLDPRLESSYLSPEWRSDVIKGAMAEVAKLVETAGTNAEIHVEVGLIADAVAGAVRKVQADLLVIGRSGRDGIAGRLPSNAYAIIRDSPCPVLSV
jgi:nucleotide-binding universal stress UspA family protein